MAPTSYGSYYTEARETLSLLSALSLSVEGQGSRETERDGSWGIWSKVGRGRLKENSLQILLVADYPLIWEAETRERLALPDAD